MKLHRQSEERVVFHCPGCEEAHAVSISGTKPVWQWNGSMDAPTFHPSLLIRSGHYIPGQTEGGKPCWCTYNREHPDDPAPCKCGVCHSFILNGHIQFLGDSTHKLAGQSVPIPGWDGYK